MITSRVMAKRKTVLIAVALVVSILFSLTITPNIALAKEVGFNAEYFNNKELSGTPTLTRTDETIDFDWVTGSPDPSINADNFSVRWVGTITPPYTDQYTFTTRSDDGIRVSIDDQTIIDNWTLHAPTEDEASIDLKADQDYQVKVEYYENDGGAVMEFYWSSQRVAKEAVTSFYAISIEDLVNIDAASNLSESEGVKLTLPAGNYTIHVIGQEDGGEYDGWLRTNKVKSCDDNGENCVKGWENKFFYQLAGASRKKVDRTGYYETAEQAIAHPPADATFTLDQETEVSFYVVDKGNPSNNQGGVSLQITGESI